MEPQSPAVFNPRAVPVGRGSGWLLEGFGYFSKSPMTWIGIIILTFVIYVAAMFIPILGSIAVNLLGPVFIAGLMLGCQAQNQGGELTVNHLFAGFSKNTAQLVIVGLLYMAGIIVLTIITVILLFVIMGGMSGMMESMQAMQSQDPAIILQHIRIFLLIILVWMALYIPLLMAFWFAPALVILDDVSPINAFILSFKGCLVNILPFTLYGIVGLVLMIIAMIPLGLGLLIFFPMVIASIYISYREIYQSG